MSRFSSAILSILLVIPAALVAQQTMGPASSRSPQAEIIYHVFQRSFYDSNGDGIGDLNGLREKLGYLQQLGVTSILMVPLYQSDFYHNYFAKNFDQIDPSFGTMQDYIRLVKEVHRRGMKIYMDMETQYVTTEHLWYRESYGHPKSRYGNYLLYDDSANLHPTGTIYGMHELHSYDGTVHGVATVNLHDTGVLAYNIRLFNYFADPNHDGKFDDGVDGFRLDHMMDELDQKPRENDLFRLFWRPLIEAVKKVNPKVIFIAEQANWGSYGFDYFTRGDIDRVFDFRLRFAIAAFNKDEIAAMADTTLDMTPPGKQQIVFIENHDLPRFASVVGRNLRKEEIGGAFNLWIGGVPSIYYGQALGMFGGLEKYGITDGNDIPKREAFEWYKADTGRGMAIWYKNTGPWWDSTHLIPNDGISLEEERNNPHSLWTFYHTIIHIRESQPPLCLGKYLTLANDQDSVSSFARVLGNQEDIVVINLSSSTAEVTVDCTACPRKPAAMRSLFGDDHADLRGSKFSVRLAPYAINLWKVD